MRERARVAEDHLVMKLRVLAVLMMVAGGCEPPTEDELRGEDADVIPASDAAADAHVSDASTGDAGTTSDASAPDARVQDAAEKDAGFHFEVVIPDASSEPDASTTPQDAAVAKDSSVVPDAGNTAPMRTLWSITHNAPANWLGSMTTGPLNRAAMLLRSNAYPDVCNMRIRTDFSGPGWTGQTTVAVDADAAACLRAARSCEDKVMIRWESCADEACATSKVGPGDDFYGPQCSTATQVPQSGALFVRLTVTQNSATGLASKWEILTP